MPFEPMDGGCRCGELRLRISAPPLLTMACHCTGCQRMTASAFSLSIAVPTEGFTIARGETVLGGLRTAGFDHHFCPRCISWVSTRIGRMDWFVNLRATMLDDPSRFVPFIESWTREKLHWATTPAMHSFPGFPPPEAYADLSRAYAAHLARSA